MGIFLHFGTPQRVFYVHYAPHMIPNGVIFSISERHESMIIWIWRELGCYFMMFVPDKSVLFVSRISIWVLTRRVIIIIDHSEDRAQIEGSSCSGIVIGEYDRCVRRKEHRRRMREWERTYRDKIHKIGCTGDTERIGRRIVDENTLSFCIIRSIESYPIVDEKTIIQKYPIEMCMDEGVMSDRMHHRDDCKWSI
jgi:hypothetical protein